METENPIQEQEKWEILIEKIARWATRSLCRKFIFTKEEVQIIYEELRKRPVCKRKAKLKWLKEVIEEAKSQLEYIEEDIKENKAKIRKQEKELRKLDEKLREKHREIAKLDSAMRVKAYKVFSDEV